MFARFARKKTIDEQLFEKLNVYFSGEYDRQVKLVEEYNSQYKSTSSSLLQQISEWITSAKSQNVDFDFSDLDTFLETLNLLVDKNAGLIDAKYKEPSRTIEIESSIDILNRIKGLMENFNVKVDNHNQLVNDIDTQKRSLINDIWALLIEENYALIKSYVESNLNIKKLFWECKQKKNLFEKRLLT